MKLHWFWRATIAIGVGIVWMIAFAYYVFHWLAFLPIFLEIAVGGVALLIIPVAIYGLLTRYYHPNRLFLEPETRCRKCHYILRGIREPICSECGERI